MRRCIQQANFSRKLSLLVRWNKECCLRDCSNSGGMERSSEISIDEDEEAEEEAADTEEFVDEVGHSVSFCISIMLVFTKKMEKINKIKKKEKEEKG